MTADVVNTFGHLTEAVLSDAVSAYSLPGSTVAAAFRVPFQMYMRRKYQEAQDRLLDEMRKGGISGFQAANQDEAIATIYRVGIAARDGAAQRNLRLLAQAVVGLARRDRLFCDEFSKYSEILARLTRDQIFVLGRLLVHHEEAQQTARTPDQESIRDVAFNALEAELVPSAFRSREHMITVYSQLTGMGLLNAGSVLAGIVYTLSPLLREMRELIDFEECLRQEGDLPRG